MASQSHIANSTDQLTIAAAAEPGSPYEVIDDKVVKQRSNLTFIQAKLAVGSPDDPYEREADLVADHVMRIPINAGLSMASPDVQLKCDKCEEEDENQIQRKLSTPAMLDIQMKSHVCEHEEEQIQRKPFEISSVLERKSADYPQREDRMHIQPYNINAYVQRKTADGSGVTSDSISTQIQSSKGGGRSMDNHTRNFMESRIGRDFSPVRIHDDFNAMQLSANLNAQAFTVGNDIFFNRGKYNPENESGKRLLAHELTHVVQQGNSNMPTIQRKEPNVADSKESDTVYVKLILRPGKGADGTMTLITKGGRQISVNVTYQGNPNPGVYHYINGKPNFDPAEMDGTGLGGFIVKYDRIPRDLRKAEEYDLIVIDTRLFSEHGVYQLSNVELAELTELTEDFSDYDFRVLKKYGAGKVRTFEEAKELIERMREGKFDYEILQLEQENLKSELYGTEKTYNLYKAYKCNANQNVSAIGINVCFLKHSDVYFEYLDSLKEELEDQLRLMGFTSSDPILEFERRISQFITNYEKIAEDLALRSLDNSQAIAEAEIEKHSSSKEAAKMHQDLGATRKHMKAAQGFATQSVIEELNGNDELGREHKSLSDKEVLMAQEEYAKLGTKYPLLGLYKMDDILDEDQDFFTSGNIITSLQTKIQSIKSARREVQKNPDYLYKLDVLKELVYAKQGIIKGSTIDLIITDKAAELEADESLLDSILLVVSLALIPFTMGQSAIIAFGATATLTGISIYSAVDAIDTYAYEKMFYDAGLSANDPSVFWVVVAVAGAGLEMGSAVSVFSKASSIAKKYPDLAVDLDKLITEVHATSFTYDIAAKLGTRMEEVEARIQASIIKQAKVQQELDLAFKAAAGNLSSKLGSNLLLDPQNFKTLGDLAYQLAKRGYYKFEEYLLMLNRRGIVKDLDKLTRQELARLKKAYTGSIDARIQDVQASKQRATFHSHIDDDFDSADELIGSSDETLEHGAKREPYADDSDFHESIREEEVAAGVNAPRSDSSPSDLDNLEPRRGLKYEKQIHSTDIGVAKGKAAAKKHKLRWLFDNPKGMDHNVSGIDSIYTDAAGNFYIVEFKGGSATLTKDQMTRDWVRRKISQIEKDPKLKDHPFVKELRKAFDNNRLRGRTYSTPVDLVTGKVGRTTMLDHGIY